jgi:hypothetical protein
MSEPYRCLSYGGGVQSTAMLLASCHGDIPSGEKPDVAIFADTQWEPPAVIEYVSRMTKYASDHGLDVVTVSIGSIRTNRGAEQMPLFTKTEDGVKGITSRHCTYDYKIAPIRQEIRRRLGYERKQKLRHSIDMWLGISTDEAQRMRTSRETNTTNVYPLIEMGWSREACKRYIEKHDLPLPMKSSCIGCPYHSNRYFLDMKRERPEEWADVVAFDKQIRSGEFDFGKLRGTPYIHRTAQPLEDVYLNEDQIELFGEECSGYCEA